MSEEKSETDYLLLEYLLNDITFIINSHETYGNRRYLILYIGDCSYRRQVIIRRLFPNCNVEVVRDFKEYNSISYHSVLNIIVIYSNNGTDKSTETSQDRVRNICNMIRPLCWNITKHFNVEYKHTQLCTNIIEVSREYTKWYKNRIDSLIVNEFVKFLMKCCHPKK